MPVVGLRTTSKYCTRNRRSHHTDIIADQLEHILDTQKCAKRYLGN